MIVSDKTVQFTSKMMDKNDPKQGYHLDIGSLDGNDIPMNESSPQKNAAHQSASDLFDHLRSNADRLHCVEKIVHGAVLIDAGIETHGSLQAGIRMAELCMGGHAEISLVSADSAVLVSPQAVLVQTDDPLLSCLGCQYAGWPVQTDDFFAMGSGPMRMARGREPMLEQLDLIQPSDRVVGVLESDKLPTESAIALMADHCGVEPSGIEPYHRPQYLPRWRGSGGRSQCRNGTP